MLTIDQLARDLYTVTSRADALALLNRASRVVGVPHDRPLRSGELRLVCDSLAAEGGPIQQIAESIALHAGAA
jgi:hypothetical protein